ncbi:hypothetical protein [Thiomonas sp.]
MKSPSVARCLSAGLLMLALLPVVRAGTPHQCTWSSMQPPAQWKLNKPLQVCRTAEGKILAANATCVGTEITAAQVARLFSLPDKACSSQYDDRSLLFECQDDGLETLLGTLTGPSGCANFNAGYLSYIAVHPFVSD